MGHSDKGHCEIAQAEKRIRSEWHHARDGN